MKPSPGLGFLLSVLPDADPSFPTAYPSENQYSRFPVKQTICLTYPYPQKAFSLPEGSSHSSCPLRWGIQCQGPTLPQTADRPWRTSHEYGFEGAQLYHNTFLLLFSLFYKSQESTECIFLCAYKVPIRTPSSNYNLPTKFFFLSIARLEVLWRFWTSHSILHRAVYAFYLLFD